MDSSQEWQNSDLFLCIGRLKGYIIGIASLTGNEVDGIGSTLNKFSHGVHIPVEYAELLLLNISKLLDSASGCDMLALFANSKSFVTALLEILILFYERRASELSREQSVSIIDSAFTSHYCYELCLYMILGLLETSTLITLTMKSVTRKNLVDLFQGLGVILPSDVLYVTQEMALEVICRVSHFILSHNEGVFLDVLGALPNSLQKLLSSGMKTIAELLVDMRPYLCAINEINENICSAKFEHIDFLPFKRDDETKKVKKTAYSKLSKNAICAGWIDVCEQVLCLQLLSSQSFVRFEYYCIGGCTLDLSSQSLEILLRESCDKLFSHLKLDQGSPDTLSTLSSGKIVLKMQSVDKLRQVACAIEKRLLKSQKDLENEQGEAWQFDSGAQAKYSVVSNKSSLQLGRKDSDISSISSPNYSYTNTEGQLLNTGENKAWHRYAGETAKDSLLNVLSEKDQLKAKVSAKKTRKLGTEKNKATKNKLKSHLTTKTVKRAMEKKRVVSGKQDAKGVDLHIIDGNEEERSKLEQGLKYDSTAVVEVEEAEEDYLSEHLVEDYDYISPTKHAQIAKLHGKDIESIGIVNENPAAIAVQPQPPLFSLSPKKLPLTIKRKGNNSKSSSDSMASKSLVDKENVLSKQETLALFGKVQSKKRAISELKGYEKTGGVIFGGTRRPRMALQSTTDESFFMKDQCKSPTPQQINSLEEEGDLRDEFRSELSPEYANEIITLSSSSNEEMTVLSNILAEVVAMQHERLRRKRVKLVSSLCQDSEKQLKIFMHHWSEYCLEATSDNYFSLDNVLSSVEKDCDDLCALAVALVGRCSNYGDRLRDLIVSLEIQLEVLQKEVEDLQLRQRSERVKVQEEAQNIRNHRMNQAKALFTTRSQQQPMKQQILKAFGGTW